MSQFLKNNKMKKILFGLLLSLCGCNPFVDSAIDGENEIVINPVGDLGVQVSEYEFLDEQGELHTIYVSFP